MLFNKKFEFIAPSYIFTEVNKYKSYIVKKVGINSNDFDMLIRVLFENIFIVPKSEYEDLVKLDEKEITDIKDIPYISVAILKKAEGIWTHDLHFKKQSKFKVFTNIDLLRLANDD